MPPFRVKEERRSLVHLPLSPCPPAVAVNDALHDGKSDAGARILLSAVQPREDAERLVHVRHVEPAVVVDKVDPVYASV